jgi:DNA-directed RNA polymerase specialized sigma subunit
MTNPPDSPGQPAGPSEGQPVRRPADQARGSRPDRAEQAGLLRSAAGGDREARESVLQAHLDWVAHAARLRAGRALGEADLLQEGTIGLLGAIDEFGSTGRDEFEPYAREQISLHMDLALAAEEASIRDAQGLVAAAEAYEGAEQQLRREHGRLASDQEIASRLEWSVTRTVEVREIVTEARRRHDQELAAFLEAEDVDPDELRRLVDEREQD